MNSVELLEHRILIALYITKCSYPSNPFQRWISREELHRTFHIEAEPNMFRSIVLGFKDEGLARTSNDARVLMICLNPNGMKEALKRILKALNADTFDVNAKQERILTDAENKDEKLIPTPNGWMLMHCEKIGATTPAPAAATPSPLAGGQIAVPVHGPVGGNVNVFMNSPHSNAAGEKHGADWWARWGTIIGGLSLLVAIIVAVVQFA